ncbi:MAG: rhomboid family intramembrane serine protease [Bdellovibrio sp.]
MILPFPENLLDYKRYPLTLTLVILNIFIFILIFSDSVSIGLSSSSMLDTEGLQLTGRLYYQHLQKIPAQDLASKPSWIHKVKSNNEDQMEALGSYALRDGVFLKDAEQADYHGDQIRIDQWKKELQQFRKIYQEQNLFRFGLNASEKKPLSWITYQFSHSNWVHLLSNLMFLILVGTGVEVLVGSGMLLFVYIIGGLAGGFSFFLWDMHSVVPMVGASASISALLVFYSIVEKRIRTRFLYVISPLPGQYGSIFLPTLLILPLFIFVDVANLLSAPEGLGGGVAYAAHIGGAFMGAVLAVIYRYKFASVLTES